MEHGQWTVGRFNPRYHLIDLMQWFVDQKPVSVWAKLKTLARNIETEDTGVATLSGLREPWGTST